MDIGACVLCGGDPAACVTLIVPGEPVSKERSRGTRSGHHYTPKKTVEAEALIRSFWPAGVPPFDVPVTLEIRLGYETRRRKDIDNASKLIMDALNRSKAHPTGIAYTDDYLVERLVVDAERGLGAGNGYTEVHLMPKAR